MVFISVTRLRLRSFLYLPQFFMANEASARELTHTPGFLGGKELIDKNLTFWTVTSWADMSSMKQFRNSLPHRKAMQKLPTWCNEAAYVHWEQEQAELPDWETLHARLVTEGNLSKVRHPSPQHLRKEPPAPKWTKLERKLKTALLQKEAV